jgi:hypothetical protein
VTHTPDITRIPNSLLSLDWQPVTPETEWYDGMLVMFAVPVCHYHRMRPGVPESRPWQIRVCCGLDQRVRQLTGRREHVVRGRW